MTGAPFPASDASRLAWAVRAGVIANLPAQLFVVPFGLVSGIVANDIGLDLAQTMFLSIVVFAGASQFALMELLESRAPALVLIATGLAINLRFVMYAASLAPELRGASLPARAGVGYVNVDNVFAASMIWFRANAGATPSERAAFFIAGGALTWSVWQATTIVGYYFGAAAPPFLSLDFAAPIAFLALVAPVLVDRPSWAAAGVATVVSLALRDLPFNLNVVLGGVAGVATGYVVDRAAQRRRPVADGEERFDE